MTPKTREIEAPNPLARTIQAQAEAAPNDDQIGEKMVLNMGPSHPASHGVLRIVLELTEKAYPKLVHYNRHPKGGHFAAWEQPKLFTTERRAAFKSPR
jgi:hypothetical protein